MTGRAFQNLRLSRLIIQHIFGHCHSESGKACFRLQNVFMQNYCSHGNLFMETSNTDGFNPLHKNDSVVVCDDSVVRGTSIIKNILKSQLSGPELEVALSKNRLTVSESLVLTILQHYRFEWKSALFFFKWVSRQQGYTHGSRASNEMLNILGRMKHINLMLQMFNELPKENVNHRTFAILLSRTCAAHDVANAIEIFYKREKYGMQPDLRSFQELLMSLCRYKHVENAEALFIQKQAEFPPDIKSWNIILNGWCVLGSYREAKRVFKDIISSGCKPDLFTYGTFINALTKAGKLTTAVNLFNKMWDKGYHPDVVICNCIIDALSFKKKIPDALRVFDGMSKRGCLPNVGTYNSLIKHICRVRRMDKAYELLEEMEQKGYLPDVRTYTYFLKATKNPDEVSVLLKRMGMTGCKIDINICNLLLNLFLRWDHYSGMESLWTELEEISLGPDRRSYTVMIHGLHRKGKFDHALRYFGEMQSKGMIPEARTFALIQDIEEKRGEVNNVGERKACELWDGTSIQNETRAKLLSLMSKSEEK